ncbi:HlyD family secretion protein [Prochlorococcus marinus]|uniref:HlyD family secretion protein n=1 Tax=Prochlorococcus marinus TaxID=1219 RepID=UPI0022B45F87|nr:HlyD family efflux transporter periplasmic adaptor subunit [Prochlorococcus marinus]
MKLKKLPIKKKLNELSITAKDFIEKNINITPKKWIEYLQDSLEKGVITRQEEVVLNQPKYWARAISWSLMGGTAFGVLWLSLGKTEEIIVATGKLEPIKGVIEIQMPLEGITKKVLVKEGEKVVKGQKLIQLDTEISIAKRQALEESLKINNDILSRLKILVREGAVSELQYLQQENKIAELKSQIKESNVIIKYQELISPSDGMVFDLKPKGPGFVARTSEPVLKIVPTDFLQARVEIPSRSIGFVSVNKKADISIDSFPATDFGVISGVVKRIGSDALPPVPAQGLGYRFPADITLDTQFLEMKTGKRLKLPLQPGMSLTANIKLRKVSYLQLLLGTFNDKAKSLKQL